MESLSVIRLDWVKEWHFSERTAIVTECHSDLMKALCLADQSARHWGFRLVQSKVRSMESYSVIH